MPDILNLYTNIIVPLRQKKGTDFNINDVIASLSDAS